MSRVITGILALGLIAVSCGDEGAGEPSAIESDPFRIHAIVEERAEPCEGQGDERGGEHTFDGGCLVLGPAALSADDVSDASKESFDGDVLVNITLTPGGAEAFDALAAENVGLRLAIVVGSRVVNTPIIQTAEFGGEVQVTGLSENDADSLIDALSP